MDILSLFTSSATAPVTSDDSDDQKKESPLDGSSLQGEFSRLVSSKEAAEAAKQVTEQIDGVYGQQVSAQLFTLLAQQGDSEEVFTREEAELWLAEIIESDQLEIDLSILDREKIIQILLGIEEDPIEEAEEEITAESDAEAILQAQQIIMDQNDTVDFTQETVLEAVNDNAVAYNEAARPLIQDIMSASTVVVSTLTQAGGGTLAGAAIQQALAKAQQAFDEMVQIIPPRQSALLTAADLADGSFSPVELLDGAYVPASQGNGLLLAAERVAGQVGELPSISRDAALINATAQAERGQAEQNQATATRTVVTASTDSLAQTQLAMPAAQEASASEHAKQATTQLQQQAANHSQSHSAQSWNQHANASDRAYTMRPGAQAGNAVDQVQMSIKHGLNSGIDRMIVMLEPADLGRVEIRMEVQDGRAQVMVTADKNETLDLLQRDARGLERALAEAGIQADANGMEFQLGGQENQEDEQGEGATGTGLASDEPEDENQALLEAGVNYTLSIEEGLNITV